MPDFTELLAAATPREVTVQVCLAGDAAGDLEGLQAELASMGDWTPTSLGESDPAVGLQEQIETTRERVLAAAAAFRFRALGHRSYSTLIAAHPAPEGSKEPYDPGTFLPALLAACCLEPGLTPAQVERLLDAVNDGTARALYQAALSVNEEPSPLPF